MTDTPNTPEPEKDLPEAENDSVRAAAAPSPETTPERASEPSPAQAPWTAPAAHESTASQPTVPQQAVPQQSGTQPTVPQQMTPPAADQQQAPAPYAPAQQGAQPDYGQGAFGPAAGYAAAQPPYAPYAHQHQYQTAPGTPAGDRPEKKRSTGLIIATLAIGALIGGVAGAGAGIGIYSATSSGNATLKTVSGPQNITVNDASNASTVTAVAAKASPSVVTISVSASSEGGTGSGIVLTQDGYILTNTHVVTLDGQAANTSISVTDNSGKIYSAKVVGTDPTTDLAVIKLDNASGMTPMTWADSSKLNVGDPAVAIGAPLGLSGTVTDGIVSALNRSISIASSAAPSSGDGSSSGNGNGGQQNPFNFDFPGQGGSGQSQSSTQGTISLPVVQTDASINPGNSGGALLNSKGELIGVNVAIASAGGTSSSSGQSGSIGVGFAIPSDLAKRISGELIKSGKASHGLLGASVADASFDTKSPTVGALIKSVTGGGGAANAGLAAGDIVTNFNGVPITNATDLTAQVRALPAGSSASVTFVRNGQNKSATVTLGSAPAR